MSSGSGPPPTGGPCASGSVEPQPNTGGRPVARVRLDLAYDGSDFRGFAENDGVPTVAGSLREALERVLGTKVALTCAGRTDAGVHARAQVVTFDAPVMLIEPLRLRRSLNSMLGPRISVSAVAVVSTGFDARFSATWRSYRYQILNRDTPDPFLARTSWWVPGQLDTPAMVEAATALVGEHDFSSFCRRPRGPVEVSLVRRVLRAEWVADGDGDLLRFEIAATAFCHQMVRSVVGTLVDIGLGRSRFSDIASVIAARDRSAAGNIAPPHGLCLWAVGYPGDPDP
jgi:tRNA pseudouridine38-40 synthase